MRLSIKSIIRWEQLNRKSFSQLDYNNEDEILSLFYTCSMADGSTTSLSEFIESLKDDDIKKMVSDFEKQTSVIGQFQPASAKTPRSNHAVDCAPAFIKDIVATLIMGGLDANYALNEMELCDLPTYTRAYELRTKENLITQRTWVYLSLSPHLKKGVKPQDIYPFAWELEPETLSDEELKEGMDEFEAFLTAGLRQ